jgi:hypothetical protein
MYLKIPVSPTQVEFYFSDSNLPKDKFLKSKVAEDPTGCECMQEGIKRVACAAMRVLI